MIELLGKMPKDFALAGKNYKVFYLSIDIIFIEIL